MLLQPRNSLEELPQTPSRTGEKRPSHPVPLILESRRLAALNSRRFDFDTLSW